jgi:phenylacetate-coenzyme A ligase PaaK-like adenylate-forming protein
MVAALEVYRPEAVIAYASVMAALADEQLEGRLDIAPRVAITTSEVLTEDAGRRIEEAWGIRPTGAYAATEAPGIATGSPEDVGMHVWEDVLVLEVIGSDGRHVPPGEPGSKVLLTNLVNRTQPLIRYELADSVVLAEGPDPTGRPWLRIARVDGRSDDILSLPARGGGEVLVHPYRLRSPFARMAQVSAYQIIQRDEDVLIRVVARTGAGRGLPDDVAAAVSSALAEADAAVPVSVALVPEIEREPGTAAKVKLVKARPRRSRNT